MDEKEYTWTNAMFQQTVSHWRSRAEAAEADRDEWRKLYNNALDRELRQLARVEAAEADAAECRRERARYGDVMTDKLAAAEATSAHWKELHGDRDRDLQHEYARANALEAEVARMREVLNALVGEEPPMDSAEALRTR